MKWILIFILAFYLSSYTRAQYTSIPDYLFEVNLIMGGYDSGEPDGLIPTASIESIEFLHLNIIVGDLRINDLTGIQDFVSLKELTVIDHNLSTIDISNNYKLVKLRCAWNKITSLDLTHNDSLEYLSCHGHLMEIIDLSKNKKLKYLSCGYSPLTSLSLINNTLLEHLKIEYTNIIALDLSKQSELRSVRCKNSSLECLNVQNGNNLNISNINFDVKNCPMLTCIKVDDPNWSYAIWLKIDTNHYFDTVCESDCSNTSIGELEYHPLLIYPNPNRGVFSIRNRYSLNGIIKIYDLFGHQVATEIIVNDEDIELTTDLSPGIYIVLLAKSGSTSNSKMIVY